MTPANESPVLDMNVVKSLKELGGEDDPNLFRELVELFLTDARANVEKLTEALEQEDPTAMQRVAHTMKSSAANVGAMRMSRLCSEIEKLCRAGSIDGAQDLVVETRREFQEVSSMLATIQG